VSASSLVEIHMPGRISDFSPDVLESIKDQVAGADPLKLHVRVRVANE
jgi:hypothetical protein